jgi:hypothetical protein
MGIFTRLTISISTNCIFLFLHYFKENIIVPSEILLRLREIMNPYSFTTFLSKHCHFLAEFFSRGTTILLELKK